MDAKEKTITFEGFAIVELMGHNIIAGYVTEQTIAGAAMLRVDVPEVNGKQAFTKFFSSTAVYAITPTDEETALIAAGKIRSRPVTEWIVPDHKALTVSVDERDALPGDYEDDYYDEDDKTRF